jgi:hypothetical protein
METRTVLTGFAIVVLDRGFVYVGDVVIDTEWCVIKNAQNIRRWGTSKGLGELALGGPTANTVLDAVGTVRATRKALNHTIDTEAAKWNAS